MKRIRVPDLRLKFSGNYRPELKVLQFIATRKGDTERGPMVRMRSSEARIRLVQDGELVWITGPRRHELGVLEIDESIPPGHVILRDIAGVTVSEGVTVVKPDYDTPVGGRQVG
ncbi:MAG TPA: hypothetical protein VM939_03860 [Gemmatimonadaceae bacterium]|nr:hypothetical protein [Gemmatimonadaceae bacterium]